MAPTFHTLPNPTAEPLWHGPGRWCAGTLNLCSCRDHCNLWEMHSPVATVCSALGMCLEIVRNAAGILLRTDKFGASVTSICFEILFLNTHESMLDWIWPFFNHFQLPLLMAAWSTAQVQQLKRDTHTALAVKSHSRNTYYYVKWFTT